MKFEPTKALESATPYEAWTNKKPSVNNMQVFGCEAFVHIPKDERDNLIPKQENAFFLGMVKEPKATGFMIQTASECFTAVM